MFKHTFNYTPCIIINNTQTQYHGFDDVYLSFKGGIFQFFKYPFLAKSFNYERHCATIIQLNVRHFILSQMRMKACYTVIFIIQTAGKQAITFYKCINDMKITFCLSNVYMFSVETCRLFHFVDSSGQFLFNKYGKPGYR